MHKKGCDLSKIKILPSKVVIVNPEMVCRIENMEVGKEKGKVKPVEIDTHSKHPVPEVGRWVINRFETVIDYDTRSQTLITALLLGYSPVKSVENLGRMRQVSFDEDRATRTQISFPRETFMLPEEVVGALRSLADKLERDTLWVAPAE